MSREDVRAVTVVALGVRGPRVNLQGLIAAAERRTAMRRVPGVMRHPYLVIGPALERLGLVYDRVSIAKLLAGDPKATCDIGRRGLVWLADNDAWLCLERRFTIRNYMSQAWVRVKRTESGRKYYDLMPARLVDRANLAMSDSRHPLARARRSSKRRRGKRPRGSDDARG